MLFAASLAALDPRVSAVSAHRGEQLRRDVQAAANPSTPFEQAGAPTDQNAFVQSGNSLDTPYSALGIDGTGYVLGEVISIHFFIMQQ
jgi:hypothetical protein